LLKFFSHKTPADRLQLQSFEQGLLYISFPPAPPLPSLLPSPHSPFLAVPSFPLEVGPLNPARGSAERSKLPQRGLMGQPPAEAEIEFGAFHLLVATI